MHTDHRRTHPAVETLLAKAGEAEGSMPDPDPKQQRRRSLRQLGRRIAELRSKRRWERGANEMGILDAQHEGIDLLDEARQLLTRVRQAP